MINGTVQKELDFITKTIIENVPAEELKVVLVKLSGKNQKRGRPPTTGTLLSGLFVLIRIFDFLDLDTK